MFIEELEPVNSEGKYIGTVSKGEAARIFLLN